MKYKIGESQLKDIVYLLNEERQVENKNVHKINSEVTVYDDIETFKNENPELYYKYFSDDSSNLDVE